MYVHTEIRKHMSLIFLTRSATVFLGSVLATFFLEVLQSEKTSTHTTKSLE